jgi:hypothetical protein
METYEKVIQNYVQGFASVHQPPTYTYHEPDLETRFAYQAGHSTSGERPNVVSLLASNFPLYSELHSTGTSSSRKAAKTSFQSFSKTLDYPSHVLELIEWSGMGKQEEGKLIHVWLFGEWSEAGPALSVSLGGSQYRVRSFTTREMEKRVSQELDWILYLESLRNQVPITDTLLVFFDWPHSASNQVERQQFMMLQLTSLYLLKPDHALLRATLATEQNRDLKYPKGKLVIPMSDNPVLEQLLLWTSNEEYSTGFERYVSATLRDQFMYFVRETFERVKYQDSMNGAVVSYVIKRQQIIQHHWAGSVLPADLVSETTEPRILLRDVEFGTDEGYLAISVQRYVEETEDDEETRLQTDKVYLVHARTLEYYGASNGKPGFVTSKFCK